MIKRTPHRILLAFGILLAISACKGGGGDSGSDGDFGPDEDVGAGNTGGGTAGGTGGQPGGESPSKDIDIDVGAAAFSGHYVTSFDMSAVRSVRESSRFAFQNLDKRLVIRGHPELDGSVRKQWNPYRDIGVDYAHSVGLSGKNRIISIIDSMPLTTHDEFDGKDIYISGVPGSSALHGTVVGSVAAGTNQSGKGMGVAPGADLHFGLMDFESGSISLTALNGYVRDAIEIGSVAMNNSWNFQKSVRHDNPDDIFSASDGKAYIDALRKYGDNGVVVFSQSNDYYATSSTLMAGLPHYYEDLEKHWLAVVSGIPDLEDDRVRSATRVSAGCNEAARWCVAANGHVNAATNTGDDSYGFAAGTSVAAPQVAGSIALLSEAFPDLTPEQLRARLIVTADNGFFRHDDTVKFAEGIEHGYNAEWGHGFVDLKAALLPIGTLSTLDASGDTVKLDSAPIVASTMSGDALSKSLSKANVILVDQMNGGFEASGDALVGADRPDRNGDNIAHMTSLDLGAFRTSLDTGVQNPSRRLMAASGGLSFDAVPVSVKLGDTMNVTMHVPAGEDQEFGIGFLKGVDTKGGRLDFGATYMRENGSVAGISSGTGMKAEHLSIEATFTSHISDSVSLSLGGSVGVANGVADGMFSDIGSVSYDSLNMTLSRKDAMVSGDRLDFYAERPAAISSGSADVLMVSKASVEGVEFSRTNVDLSPDSRQIDVGFDYARPIARNTEMAAGIRHSLNSGNVADMADTTAVIGLQMRF